MITTTTSWRHERECCQFLQQQRPDKTDYRYRRPLTPPLTSERNASTAPIKIRPAPIIDPNFMVQAFKTKFHARHHVSHPEPITPTQMISDQAQAPLLQLPAEIRNAIFQEAIGGRTLHLVTYKKRIHHVTCSGDESCTGCMTRRQMLREHEMKVPSVAGWVCFFRSNGTLLPLLITCRRIYSEAAGLLYSTNTFGFADLFTFLDFIATIPPTRIDQIHFVNLSYLFRQLLYPDDHIGFLPPFHRSTWEDVWAAMARLRGLLSLHIQLADQYMDEQCPRRLFWYLDYIELIVALETPADIRITIPHTGVQRTGVHAVPRHELKRLMIEQIPPDDQYHKQWRDGTRCTPTEPTPSGADMRCSYCNTLRQRRLVSRIKWKCSYCHTRLKWWKFWKP